MHLPENGDTRDADCIIVSATVGAFPKDLVDVAMPNVTVTYSDGNTEMLFTFYPDEISFTADEFVGLTRQQALSMRRHRDTEYLQTPTERHHR
ncbi:hypothetical protein [Gordonia otitidis]|nr:hypothetical protein [Gordonia otitidis]